MECIKNYIGYVLIVLGIYRCSKYGLYVIGVCGHDLYG
jgi:hypothetical protein